MLLLFTSGTRPRYVEDVLDILNLPQSATTTIQYSIKSIENTSYIHELALPNHCILDEDVLVIFINRDIEESYQYIPLRKAKYICGEVREEIAYYTIELGEVCSVEDYETFSEIMKKDAQGYLYEHSGRRKRTGYFVFRLNGIVNWDIKTKDSSWRDTTKQIAECKCFKSIFPIFTKFCLYETGQPQQIMLKKDKKNRYYLLRYGRYYTAKIDYYIPDAKTNPNRVTANINIDTLPDCLESTTPALRFGAESGMVEYAFRVKGVSNHLELRYGEAEKEGNKQKLFIASRSISFKTIRSRLRWILIFGSLALMLICDIADKFPVDKIIEASAQNSTALMTGFQQIQLSFANLLKYGQSVYPAVVSMIKSGLTFLLVLLYGKNDR